MFFFILGIIALIAFWCFLLYLSVKNFIIEDLHPLYMLGAGFFLYFFAKAIYAIAIGG